MTFASTVQVRNRAFFITMAVLLGIAVFAGFARSYYLRPLFVTGPLSPLLQVHGAIFSAWMLLFVAQAALLRSGRRTLHRQLGMIGGVLALAMVVVGFHTGVVRAATSANPPRLLAFALGDIFMFAPLVAAGIYWRNRLPVHKRFMLLATISIVDSGTARWPIWAWIGSDTILNVSLAYAARNLFAIAAMIYDKKVHGRVHPVYLWGGIALIASDAIRLMVIDTEVWRAFTAFLIGSGL
jgi:hypothetical protein